MDNTDLSRMIPGNQIALLQNGEAYFPAIEAALNRADGEIYLEAYIFKADATGRRIAEALKRAALRGVATTSSVPPSQNTAGNKEKRNSV